MKLRLKCKDKCEEYERIFWAAVVLSIAGAIIAYRFIGNYIMDFLYLRHQDSAGQWLIYGAIFWFILEASIFLLYKAGTFFLNRKNHSK